MSLESPREMPDLIKNLVPIKRLFLDQGPVDQNQRKPQQTLRAIWSICDGVFPLGMRDIKWSVPAIRLVELGLVSDQTGHRMKRRVDVIKGVDELLGKTGREVEKNTITIEKIADKDGFTLTERYVNMDEPLRINNGRGYLDTHTEEQSQLVKMGQQFKIDFMGRRQEQFRLHALDRVWIPEDGRQQTLSQFEPIEVTGRRINTTLALLVEGLYPGCI